MTSIRMQIVKNVTFYLFLDFLLKYVKIKLPIDRQQYISTFVKYESCYRFLSIYRIHILEKLFLQVFDLSSSALSLRFFVILTIFYKLNIIGVLSISNNFTRKIETIANIFNHSQILNIISGLSGGHVLCKVCRKSQNFVIFLCFKNI